MDTKGRKMGTANKKHNRQIKECKCPVCGGELIVLNQGKDWWVACFKNTWHVPQYLYRHADEAVAYALKNFAPHCTR